MTPTDFIARIKSRDAVVGVIGLGYVGLPLAVTFCRAGFRVIGFDIDPEKTTQLSAGESYIRHIPSDAIRESVDSGKLEATTDYSRAAEADALLICVPTPLTGHHEPDLTYVDNTGRAIAPYLRAGQLVVLESTTYPGTTEELLRPILEAGGLSAASDFFLAYSPEREDPGNASFSTSSTPKVVGACTPEALEAADALYSAIVVETVRVSDTQTAEAAKLLENIYRGVNIALVNELKVIYSRMGIDVWEVIRAASTKPFGFMPFYPGPGLGGHCIPIDPFYLAWKAREYGITTRFIELAGEINTAMPEYVVARVSEALNDHRKPLNGSRILVLGIAYKPDVADSRESPGVTLIELLMARGAQVQYNDPYVPKIPPMRKHDLDMASVDLSPESLAATDCVLIATNHSDYDYGLIVEHAPLVVDTRNATAHLIPDYPAKIYKA